MALIEDSIKAPLESKPTEGDYEVGYKKPPKHTQFKPRQSGNTKGRPKGSMSKRMRFAKHLNRKVQVPGDKAMETMTMADLIDRNLIIKAAKGSIQHIKHVKELEDKYAINEPSTPITHIIVTFPEPPVWPPDPPLDNLGKEEDPKE